MGNERCYDKAKTKSEPTGIRFDLKQLPIALGKARVKTRQQLVTYLIDRFVNGESEMKVRQWITPGSTVTDIDTGKVTTNNTDKLLQISPKGWQQFMNEIAEVKNIDECSKLKGEIEQSGLPANTKRTLLDNLVKQSKEFYNE